MADELDAVDSKDEVQNKMLEDFGEQKFEQMKKEAEESDGVETDDDVEKSDQGVTTPQMESASVVKYSVKTTPYLQR